MTMATRKLTAEEAIPKHTNKDERRYTKI